MPEIFEKAFLEKGLGIYSIQVVGKQPGRKEKEDHCYDQDYMRGAALGGTCYIHVGLRKQGTDEQGRA